MIAEPKAMAIRKNGRSRRGASVDRGDIVHRSTLARNGGSARPRHFTSALHDATYYPIRSPLAERAPARATLHVRAGVVGERAYDADRPEILVQVFADGVPVGSLAVPRTVRDGTGWRRLDLPLPAGATEREFVFALSSPDRARSLCLQAWTSG